MKNKLTYFLLGVSACLVFSLFVNAAGVGNKYFSFIKKGSGENLAMPVQTTFAVKLPESVSFAGEAVPLDDPEVRERLDRELTVNAYWQSATIFLMKRANRFFPTIEKILTEEGVPQDFKYLALAESGLDNVVSSAGAAGYWQFLKSSGIQYGLTINDEIDQRYDIEKSTRAACKYLKYAYGQTGSWTAAAGGYNMGISGISKQQALQGETAYYHLLLNSETSRYVQRIVALKIIMENPKDYGFYLTPEDLYPPFKYTTQTVSCKTNWVEFAKSNNISYKLLRVYNPWIRDMNYTNKDKGSYEVKIPQL